MLVMAVSVVDVIDMISMLDSLVAVSFEVFAFVILVNHFFGMEFAIMAVVNVAVVFDGLVAVTGQVLMIGSGVAISHVSSASKG